MKHILKKIVPIVIDHKAICSIDHACKGCADVSRSCCAKYDVTVTQAEMDRINGVLPEAARLCPRLKTEEGYANVFEETEDGQFSIETDEDDLCVFAYRNEGLIRCALHSVEKSMGLPLGAVKPAVCILYPLTFLDDGKTLTLHGDALGCHCSVMRKEPSDRISPELQATIAHFSGETSFT